MPRLINLSEAVSLGLHAMALLATSEGRRVGNREMADTLAVSGHHLAKVMQRLVKAGLVDSMSGPRGGFLLGAAPKEIRLLTIYEAVEGGLDKQGCLLAEPICKGGKCELGEILDSIHQQLRDYLGNTTLAELAERSPLDKSLRPANGARLQRAAREPASRGSTRPESP